VIVVPCSHQKTKIDGIIDDAEWQGAASVNALQTAGKMVSMKQVRF